MPSIAEVDSWFKPADWPFHRTDDSADSPIIYAHLSLFTDATVICTSIPHATCDQMGLSQIVNAWLGLAEGIQPKPLTPSDQDVLPGKSRSYSKAEISRKGRQRVMGKGEYALVVMPFIPDLVLNSKEEPCTLFFPHELVKSLRKRHSEALREKHGNLPRISDGDILAAVLLKFCRLTKSSTRTVSLSQSVNLHGRAPNLDNYIHNCLFDSTARLPVGPSTSIGDIAFANRQALETAARPEDFEISMATYREMCRRRQSSHTCEPGDRSFYVSNWSAAWRGIDFSSVVKGEKKAEGIPKFVVLGQSKQLSDPSRFTSLILSRTDDGYYVDFAGTPPTMKSLKKHLAKDPLLESL
ncbi:hypothetical protein VHEMI05237 [[Torrubiella] hemipterigena]|uniref:Uncharacterized protein n=1 Tax=[Torrubiella] hemipterigena TaxID=1531966 RepID=A0A0A1TGJ0_9HYPO|nr:hypothetical protein VHEMI05237 [[Torrubiella] hemipterigena]